MWEWIDHGFTATTADGMPFVMHGDDVDYEPRGGRFSLHGLVFSDRTPTPALVELAKAYAPDRDPASAPRSRSQHAPLR